MTIIITTCPKCESQNLKDLNGELKDTVKKETVQIKTKCLDCGHEFEYCSATAYGHRKGIMY